MSNKDIEAYSEMEDFGFSSYDESLVNDEISGLEEHSRELQERLESCEKLIMPLLSKLYESADESDTIYWPNRKEIIEAKIEELLSITRIGK